MPAMPLETVQISVVDDTLSADPVDGVVVRVYDSTGTTLITEATTGDVLSGAVELVLDGDDPALTYQLRFYILGGSIRSPQYIEVFSPPALAPTGANNFEIEATVFTLPTAPNPRLCRASGYIWRPDGRPNKGVDLAFVPCFRPLVVEGYGVLGERVNARTDKNGFVQIDLIREGLYLATVESHENVQREVMVPDRSSINIMHLLFPIIGAISYDPLGPFALNAGDFLEITPTLTATDFRELTGTAHEDVVYSTDDPSIATVEVRSDRVVIYGVAAGTTNLRVSRRDTSIVYIPDPGINGEVTPIVVS